MPNHRIYLPLIIKPSRFELQHPIGADIEGTAERSDLIAEVATRRHFKIAYRWTEYERNGDHCYMTEPNNIQALAAIGTAERYVSFKTCPQKYRLWPEYIGSPPKPEHYEDAGYALANALIESRAAYGEFMNEPNVYVTQISPATQWYFGAWIGAGENAYTGGKRYGEAARVVREVVRRQAPGCDLILGALIGGDLAVGGHNYEFIRGMLEACGGRLPGVAFSAHAYVDFSDYPNHTEEGKQHAFNGVKTYAQQLKVLTNLPILFSEASLITPDDTQDSELFRQWQADYVAFLNNLVIQRLIASYTWYSWAAQWPWWHNSLIRGACRGDPNLQPTPAFYAWEGSI